LWQFQVRERKQALSNQRAERQPGRFDGVRSTTPYESQKVPADGRQDIKFADQLNIYYDEVMWIDHRKAVIVAVSSENKRYRIRIDGVRSTYESGSQMVDRYKICR
jgi:hypothetical protein